MCVPGLTEVVTMLGVIIMFVTADVLGGILGDEE